MPELLRTVDDQTLARSNEVVFDVIAGPITAAQLGVPVGSIVESRHVVAAVDGATVQDSVITANESAAISERIMTGLAPGTTQEAEDRWRSEPQP